MFFILKSDLNTLKLSSIHSKLSEKANSNWNVRVRNTHFRSSQHPLCVLSIYSYTNDRVGKKGKKIKLFYPIVKCKHMRIWIANVLRHEAGNIFVVNPFSVFCRFMPTLLLYNNLGSSYIRHHNFITYLVHCICLCAV